jgi:hypothetical protein
MNIGIRFLLSYNHFMQMIITKERADEIITKWKSGHYNLQRVNYVTGQDVHGVEWAIKIEHILAIHTFDPMEIERQSKAEYHVSGSIPPYPQRISG